MSATKRLRCLLDRRHVKWWPDNRHGDTDTCWKSGCFAWRASEQGDGRLIVGCTSVSHISPDRAAATTGEMTCYNASKMFETGFRCSECGVHVDVDAPNYCPSCGSRVIL